ncbi:MAG TPA: TonB-dependent receptor [Bryobacteraceae bacterium]|jgi:hypothetical protein|nr:TonB-dependent receptor [Bryobacteraceae bacterium]
MASLVLLASAGSAMGADLSLPVTGELLGRVVDNTGVPQLGAAVQLFNRYQRLVGHASTNSDGRFAFTGLPADSYSVRVSVATYLPASRDHVLVKAGLDSVLEIHLATLLSSIEVRYQVPTGAMTDEWKWALRSSPRTRLITRVLPEEFPDSEPKLKPHIFSGTHAMLAVNGGDGGLVDPSEMTTDVGTSFAVSTNIFGKNQLQVAGTLGQSAEFGPSAIALCAIYSRTDEGLFASAPEVSFQMAQVGGFGGQLNGGQPTPVSAAGTGIPTMRTMALGVYQTTDPLDLIHIEYGATGETVEYAQHANRVSPYARMTADLGGAGSVVATYSDGGRPYELVAHQQSGAADDIAIDDLSAPVENLSHLPRVAESGGHLELERTQNYELGYQKKSGDRTYAVSGFYERVWNRRLNVAGDLSGLDGGNLYSDGLSKLSSYNIGRFRRTGYLASVDQRLSNNFDLSIAYARMGGFTDAGETPTDVVAARFLNEKMHNVAAAGGKARIPGVGTRIMASYGWVDAQAAIPTHLFTTQNTNALPGVNVLVRQPLPSFFGMPGRLELTADLRNLLAQGYVPVAMANGQHLLVVEAPRAIRGGLKFTF